MTSKKSSVKVGFIARSHGIKGELFLSPLHSSPDWPAGIKSLKIGKKNFEVERCSSHKKGFIVRLKGCDNKTQADLLQFQDVYLDKNLFKSKSSGSFYLMELLDFTVEIEGEKEKGPVLRFESDNKNQDFLVVDFPASSPSRESGNRPLTQALQKTRSIPFIKAYIKKIDFKKKQILFKLPPDFLKLF